jgi:alpha-tubulin suppressor-like RCC1 family protein
VKKIAAGLNHAVMITAEGAAYAWGDNACGQVGTGNFDAAMRPVRILTDVVVDDVAVGSQHTLALARDGRLFAFGCNGRGALGRNPSALNVTATPVEVSTPETFVAVAAAGAHSVGLTAGGAVYTWGANHEGQLGACEARGREKRTTRLTRRARRSRWMFSPGRARG